MSQPNGAHGPLVLAPIHIEELNRVFSDTFTDRYHRDGMTGVRVPELSPAIWRFAMDTAGAGAMHWRDPQGRLAAFNLAHVSGQEGWMGPLAVRPDWQRRGLGGAIVMAAVERLRQAGCRTIGLETMPRTVDNIGFYSRLGFHPGHLTVAMVRDVRRNEGAPAELATRLGPPDGWLEDARALAEAVLPGADFTREIGLTLAQSLGDLTVVRRGGRWAGYAVWHSAPLAAGRVPEEIRILKIVAEDPPAFRAVLEGAIREAGVRGLGRVAVRAQSAFRGAYGDLIDQGLRVHWTDLRMSLAAHPERHPATGVLFSNWEI